MMSTLNSEIEKMEWNLDYEKSEVQLYVLAIISLGLIPFFTTAFAIILPAFASVIYLFGKVAMISASFKSLKEVFELSSWKNIQWKRLSLTTALLGFPPILLLALNPYLNLDITGIQNHLSKFQLQEHLIYLVSFLCLGNALLEEAFFRAFLNHSTIQGTKAKALNALLFMPHHLVITTVYFSWPLALLFTFATGVAGWFWMDLRLKGAKLPELWISHFTLDVIVIAGALFTFNLI